VKEYQKDAELMRGAADSAHCKLTRYSIVVQREILKTKERESERIANNMGS